MSESTPAVELQRGPAFHLQPDGTWSVEDVPVGVAADSSFSGYLTINGYRCTVFETADGDQWAQKSVNTPASTAAALKPDMSRRCPECGGRAVDVRAMSACCPNGHYFSVKPRSPSRKESKMSTVASAVAAKWLHRQAKGKDLVSQVGDILDGNGGQSGGTDGEYDEAIVEYCEEVRKVLPRIQSIFDGAFHDLVDFKAEVPEPKHPRVRQIGQEQVSKAVNEAATRIELLSFSLMQELEQLLSGLEAGAAE